MSASKRDSSSNSLKVRQTMFEFLKRKKHTELENSLKQFNLTSKKYNQGTQKKNIQHSRAKSSAQYDDFVLQQKDTIPLFSNKTNKFSNPHRSITPRKITFLLDQTQPQLRSSRKPLLQLISPIKNIPSLNKTTNFQQNYHNQRSNKQVQSNSKKSILKQSGRKKNNSQPFSKRKINESLNLLKDTFHRMFEAGHQAKDKTNQLSISLVNFVKDLLKNYDKENAMVDKQILFQKRKLAEIKYILKAMNSSLQIFSDQNQAQNIIEQFNTNFTEHLNEIQSSNNHNFRQQVQEQTSKFNQQKDTQINQLSTLNNKLQRQIDKLNKKIEKMQNQHEHQIKNSLQRQQNLLQTIQNLKNSNQQNQQVVVDKISLLQQQLDQQKSKSKKLQKKLKDLVYTEQKTISNELQKKNEQFNARQTYLLQQIETLKHSFISDISDLHSLYQAKQQQYDKKIEVFSKQLQRQQNQRKCDRAVVDRILSEANIARNQLMITNKKNQEVIQDIYRLNEDFFRHWLALKDVKTLSERLNIYPYFERIYLDLAFNPILFRD